MIAGHRIHKEQLQQIATMMKTLYGQKKMNSGKKPAPSGDQEPENKNAYGTFGARKGKVTSVRKSRTLSRSTTLFCHKMPDLPIGQAEKIVTGIECPVCGELFLQGDSHYTEGTGLCIPCWEKETLSC